jgi:hypothetical protein
MAPRKCRFWAVGGVVKAASTLVLNFNLTRLLAGLEIYYQKAIRLMGFSQSSNFEEVSILPVSANIYP